MSYKFNMQPSVSVKHSSRNLMNRFTLIELLIVIAIIAILASMLLPALSQARKRAKTIACVGNLKNLSSLYEFYTNDFNNRYPNYSRGWRRTLWEYQNPNSSKTWWETFTSGNQWSLNSIFICPETISYLDKTTNSGNNNITYAQGLTVANTAWVSFYYPKSGINSFSTTTLCWCHAENHWQENQTGSPVITKDTHDSGRPILYADGHAEINSSYRIFVSPRGLPANVYREGWNYLLTP